MSRFRKELGKQYELQLMLIPGIIFLFIFSYIPIYGLLMAFQEYRLGDFPGISKWVGLTQFKYLINDPTFPSVLKNTIVISALKLLFSFPMPIIFAILLNEITAVRFKKTVQTISYLPHFISWIVAAGLIFDLLSVDGGTINQLLMALNIIKDPIFFLGGSQYTWLVLIISDIWKTIGWSSIIYIAAITSINNEMYEAAEIDGAGRFRKIWNITLPTIRPTIIILFIFAIGGMLNANFDQIMMLTSSLQNYSWMPSADVIDTYVYRIGIGKMRYSYAAAAGLFKSAINFLLLLMANFISNKLSDVGVM